jgi:hypothetical protein
MFLENIAPRRGRKSQNRNARNPGNVTSSGSSTQHGLNERLLSRLLPGRTPGRINLGDLEYYRGRVLFEVTSP